MRYWVVQLSCSPALAVHLGVLVAWVPSAGSVANQPGMKIQKKNCQFKIKIFRCEFCDEKTYFCDECHRGAHSYQQCYKENIDIISSYPDSDLYQCRQCGTPLKLWPSDKLTSSECFKCQQRVDNNGHNLHVCFGCQDGKSNHHLCGDHTTGGEMGLRDVNFDDKDSIPDNKNVDAVVDV